MKIQYGILFLVISALFLNRSALAAPVRFNQFNADIPAGWLSHEENRLVLLSSEKQDCFVTIMVDNAGDASGEEIAKQASAKLGGTPPQRIEGTRGTYYFAADVNGVSLENTITADQGLFLYFAVAGETQSCRDAADAIYTSLNSDNPTVKQLLR